MDIAKLMIYIFAVLGIIFICHHLRSLRLLEFLKWLFKNKNITK